jgi:hypothetical protein
MLADQRPDLGDQVIEFRVADEVVELLDVIMASLTGWKDGGIGGWGVERSCTVKRCEIESRRGLGKVRCRVPNR